MNMHMYLRIQCMSDDACQFLNYDRNKIVKSYTPHILTFRTRVQHHASGRDGPPGSRAALSHVNVHDM